MKLPQPLVALVTTLVLVPALALAQTAAPLEEPAKSLPAPTADISPQMQKLIAAPLNPNWALRWKTGEEARAFADKQAAETVTGIPAMLARLHVTLKPEVLGGARVFVVTPADIPASNRNKVLIHVHGGCYVLFPGESGTTEAIPDGRPRPLQGHLGRLPHAAGSLFPGRPRRRHLGL